jgi:hypothetical protein
MQTLVDHLRGDTDALQEKHLVKSIPQTFIHCERAGRYEAR